MNILVSGATGLIGRALLKHAGGGVSLSRAAPNTSLASDRPDSFAWQPEFMPPPAAAFNNVDAVFHLAGESVADGRWTTEKKQRILDSRVLGTRHLVQTLSTLPRKPQVLVSASAIGFYGSRGDEVLDERASAGTGFLAQVCQEWEKEALLCAQLGIRVVCVRIGFVLAAEGGALSKMIPAYNLGMGGPMGDGDQWMSPVHIDDVVGLMIYAAANPQIEGIVNAVGLKPLTNRSFSRELGRVMKRPAVVKTPAFALRLALGEMSELLLSSQRVIPEVALKTGYSFKYPDVASALQAIRAASRPYRPPHRERS